MTIKIELIGLNKSDLVSIKRLLDEEITISVKESNARAGGELLSAAFVLGALQAVPHLIKSLTEVLSEIRKTKYYTFKITNEEKNLIVEGAATEERIKEFHKLFSSE